MELLVIRNPPKLYPHAYCHVNLNYPFLLSRCGYIPKINNISKLKTVNMIELALISLFLLFSFFQRYHNHEFMIMK